MDERLRARRRRPLRPGRRPPSAPPVLIGHGRVDGPRRFTERHALLLAELRDAPGPWSQIALHACLEHLRVSTVTAAAQVSVTDAWIDGPDAFCIVYRPPLEDARVVGVRRARLDALEPGEWRIGDMTTWGYDLGLAQRPGHVDPVAFGWNVADFDVGEPLGFVATVLRYDSADIGWWGSLRDDLALPRPPSTASE